MKNYLARFLLVILVILVLIIPTILIKSLVSERKSRRTEAITAMGETWGRPKTLYGLFLGNNYHVYLPETIKISGEMKAETRNKGIFKIPFYRARVIIRGKFEKQALSPKKKFLYLAISDTDSVRITGLTLNGKKLWSGSVSSQLLASYPAIRVALPEHITGNDASGEFAVTAQITGVDSLHFIAPGKNSSIAIKSNWKDPNFTGTRFPMERTISREGFTAEWHMINPDSPRTIRSVTFEEGTSYGVNLFVPVDIYSQTDRSIKYALLFICLTFLTFFIMEILNPIRIHPLQYLLVGFALTLFYLLLLSLSEHISFGPAYLLAAVPTILLISAYSWKILVSLNRSLVTGGLLAGLYTFLYILLQLETYTLLIGSIFLFIILAMIMYVTRNIDWFEMAAIGHEKINSKEKHKI